MVASATAPDEFNTAPSVRNGFKIPLGVRCQPRPTLLRAEALWNDGEPTTIIGSANCRYRERDAA
jgi:hypothetical protein